MSEGRTASFVLAAQRFSGEAGRGSGDGTGGSGAGGWLAALVDAPLRSALATPVTDERFLDPADDLLEDDHLLADYFGQRFGGAGGKSFREALQVPASGKRDRGSGGSGSGSDGSGADGWVSSASPTPEGHRKDEDSHARSAHDDAEISGSDADENRSGAVAEANQSQRTARRGTERARPLRRIRAQPRPAWNDDVKVSDGRHLRAGTLVRRQQWRESEHRPWRERSYRESESGHSSDSEREHEGAGKREYERRGVVFVDGDGDDDVRHQRRAAGTNAPGAAGPTSSAPPRSSRHLRPAALGEHNGRIHSSPPSKPPPPAEARGATLLKHIWPRAHGSRAHARSPHVRSPNHEARAKTADNSPKAAAKKLAEATARHLMDVDSDDSATEWDAGAHPLARAMSPSSANDERALRERLEAMPRDELLALASALLTQVQEAVGIHARMGT